MMSIQEDDVIYTSVSFLRSIGHIVLAGSGNQAGLFNFHLPSGKRKAPDVVAVINSHILVCEAKVKSSDLLRSQKDDICDMDVMIYLANSSSAQLEIIDNVNKVLHGIAIQLTSPRIVTGLISFTPYGNIRSILLNSSLTLIRSNPTLNNTSIESDPHLLF